MREKLSPMWYIEGELNITNVTCVKCLKSFNIGGQS